MTCASCGCDQATGAQFCVRCGQRTAHAAPLGWAPVMGQAAAIPAISFDPFVLGRGQDRGLRVVQHVRALGLLWCAFGALRLLTHGGGFMHHGSHTIFFSALAVLAGFGLLTHKPWARKLSLVLGVLCLFQPPFGTALGIYTLWVMASSQARDQWRGMESGAPLW